jgi:protein TonB
MKKLLLSITAAIFLHAAFLSADFSSLRLFPSASLELNPVTMTLIAYVPPDRNENLPAAGRQAADPQLADPIEKPDAILPAPASTLPPKNTAEPPPKEDQAPVLPEREVETDQFPPPEPEAEVKPVKTILPKQPPEPTESMADADTGEPAEPVQVWQKPKRSLKAQTKVIPPKAAAGLQRSAFQNQKPAKVPQKRNLSTRPPDNPRTKSEAAESAGSPAGRATAQDTPSLPEALENAANAVASVNKQVPAPKIITARPLYRRNPPPNYPKRAQRRGLEGMVILDVRVNKAGEVKDLTVFRSSGHKMLDRAAVKSVRKWLFQPGTRNGQKIETRVRVPVRFRLQ